MVHTYHNPQLHGSGSATGKLTKLTHGISMAATRPYISLVESGSCLYLVCAYLSICTQCVSDHRPQTRDGQLMTASSNMSLPSGHPSYSHPSCMALSHKSSSKSTRRHVCRLGVQRNKSHHCSGCPKASEATFMQPFTCATGASNWSGGSNDP